LPVASAAIIDYSNFDVSASGQERSAMEMEFTTKGLTQYHEPHEMPTFLRVLCAFGG
jgi:hypothetical protein